ncbi:MAG TPA: 5-oxoprolinase subunit PxpB [Gemmatimonadales bacterium]|nr:5-oxoprolinase subunit PxpB [Gemmatimonadales bacterium]
MSGFGATIVPLGEQAWTVVLGETVDRLLHQRVTALAGRIAGAKIPGLVEIVPAYATVTVFFEGDAEEIRRRLVALCHPERSEGAGGRHPDPERSEGEGAEPQLHTIPVRYTGPDLAFVATETGLTPEQVVERHSGREYLVYLLGFVPGFGYLGDLDPSLVLPRRATPRTRVPAGSVAIAGAQTAVYPLATPGGWHLIGATTMAMFDPAREPPALLRAGDRVRFEPMP